MKTFVNALILIFLTLGVSRAETQIKTYESTENAGQNKKERIDTVESYLMTLSTSLQKMESKLDENAKKISSLEQIVKALKESEAKKVDAKLGETQKTPAAAKKEERPDQSELDKLKADVLALKNQDIEKLKVNLDELNDTVKAIQATLRK